MQWCYHDGGRAAAGYTGSTGDCVTRAIAIATGLPYQDVYDQLNTAALRERRGARKRGVSNARTGVYKGTIKRYLRSSMIPPTRVAPVRGACMVFWRAPDTWLGMAHVTEADATDWKRTRP